MKCKHGVLGPCAQCRGERELAETVRDLKQRITKLEHEVMSLKLKMPVTIR